MPCYRTQRATDVACICSGANKLARGFLVRRVKTHQGPGQHFPGRCRFAGVTDCGLEQPHQPVAERLSLWRAARSGMPRVECSPTLPAADRWAARDSSTEGVRAPGSRFVENVPQIDVRLRAVKRDGDLVRAETPSKPSAIEGFADLVQRLTQGSARFRPPPFGSTIVQPAARVCLRRFRRVPQIRRSAQPTFPPDRADRALAHAQSEFAQGPDGERSAYSAGRRPGCSPYDRPFLRLLNDQMVLARTGVLTHFVRPAWGRDSSVVNAAGSPGVQRLGPHRWRQSDD